MPPLLPDSLAWMVVSTASGDATDFEPPAMVINPDSSPPSSGIFGMLIPAALDG